MAGIIVGGEDNKRGGGSGVGPMSRALVAAAIASMATVGVDAYLLLVVNARNRREYADFVARHALGGDAPHPWVTSRAIICRTESGVVNAPYSHDCDVTHDNLQVGFGRR